MDKNDLNIIVANKIDKYQLVINKGNNDRIDSYMRFLVYEEGEEIIDPLTKRSLGYLEKPKGFFKVFHIQDNMTILISELKKDKTSRINSIILNNLNEEIDVEHVLLSQIKIGDKVKIINKLRNT